MDELDRQLLNCVQHDFPLDRHPFAVLASQCGITENQCIERLGKLVAAGILREIRPVINWRSAGFTGVLIGIQVTEDSIDAVAAQLNLLPGVTHNYKREGRLNLWCTLTYDGEEEHCRQIAFMRSLEGVVDVKEFASEKTYKIGLVLDV